MLEHLVPPVLGACWALAWGVLSPSPGACWALAWGVLSPSPGACWALAWGVLSPSPGARWALAWGMAPLLLCGCSLVGPPLEAPAPWLQRDLVTGGRAG